MSLEQVTEGMRERVGEDSGLGATLKFDFGDVGVVYVDGTATPNTVSNEDIDADCTISMTLEDFMSMVNGELDGTTAFMMGKLKVAGDMGIAMKIQSVLG